MYHAGVCVCVCVCVPHLFISKPSVCLVQIQMHSEGAPKYTSSIDCGRQLFREGGIRSLYKGTMATLLRGSVPV